MRCSNCDAAIPEEEQFCPQCGVPVGVVAKCPHCGAAMLPGEQFCGECGQKVPDQAPSPKAGRPVWFWVLIALGGAVLLG